MPVAQVDRALRAEVGEVASSLLALREDQWYERKSILIRPVKLAEAFVAFANAEGGVIVVGLSDGRVESLDRETARVNELQRASDHTQPRVRAVASHVECVDQDGNAARLLVFSIQPSDVVHRLASGACFLRVGDTSRELRDMEAAELEFDKGATRYETTEVRAASLDEIDRPLLENYSNIVGNAEAFRILEDRTLTTAEKITVAGCLLFWRNPQKYLPNAAVRITRYSGISRQPGRSQNVIFDQRIEGPLPRMIQNAQATMKEHQPTRLALAGPGRFEQVPTVPEDAWLEGLVNACVHRSYSLDGDHVHVDIFDDRMEIFSPGRFPHVLDLDDPLGIRRYARNPRIVRVCFDLKICLEQGEGIRRIYDEMRAAGLRDPLYTQDLAGVTLTLSSAPMNELLDRRFPEGIREIMRALRESKRMSTAEIVDALGGSLSRPAVRARLDALRVAGLVHWYGKSAKDPRAYWYIPEEIDRPGGGATDPNGEQAR